MQPSRGLGASSGGYTPNYPAPAPHSNGLSQGFYPNSTTPAKPSYGNPAGGPPPGPPGAPGVPGAAAGGAPGSGYGVSGYYGEDSMPTGQQQYPQQMPFSQPQQQLQQPPQQQQPLYSVPSHAPPPSMQQQQQTPAYPQQPPLPQQQPLQQQQPIPQQQPLSQQQGRYMAPPSAPFAPPPPQAQQQQQQQGGYMPPPVQQQDPAGMQAPASGGGYMMGGVRAGAAPLGSGSVGGAGSSVMGGPRSSFYPGGAATAAAATAAAAAAAAAAVQQQQEGVSQQQTEDLLQLNAPAAFVRPSVWRIPSSSSLRHKSHLPLGVVLQPLARMGPHAATVPRISFGSGLVIRCRRCRTYVNAFVTWEAGGRRWLCNMCGVSNETPQFYCAPLDANGKREDAAERPELSRGSFEIIAPGDYMIRPPQPPAFVFVVDVSQQAVASGLPAAACSSIAAAIEANRLPGEGRTLAAVLTYDSSVHFYRLEASQTRPRLFVVPQVQDIFLPLAENLFVPLQECKEAILNTLNAIPDIWKSNACTDNCLVHIHKHLLTNINEHKHKQALTSLITTQSSSPPCVCPSGCLFACLVLLVCWLVCLSIPCFVCFLVSSPDLFGVSC